MIYCVRCDHRDGSTDWVVCVADTPEDAIDAALREWPNTGLLTPEPAEDVLLSQFRGSATLQKLG